MRWVFKIYIQILQSFTCMALQYINSPIRNVFSLSYSGSWEKSLENIQMSKAVKKGIWPVPLPLMTWGVLLSQSSISPVMGSNDTCRTHRYCTETVENKLKEKDNHLRSNVMVIHNNEYPQALTLWFGLELIRYLLHRKSTNAIYFNEKQTTETTQSLIILYLSARLLTSIQWL